MRPRAQPLALPAHLGPDPRVEVELGCADGQFSFQLARANPDTVVVGIDIREGLVATIAELARQRGVANLAFAYANVNIDLDRVFAPRSVDRFHILFPDPWFKTKHAKRRIIEPGLLAVIGRQLRPGGELHFASDVFEVALQAMAEIEEAPGFDNLLAPWSFWRGNPFGAQSRREDRTRARGQRVWRMRYGVSADAPASRS